ncbi:MAG: TolC family protein [Pararheinheimera sp.]|nr:TolC family protein [Rheinheimera sp.]
MTIKISHAARMLLALCLLWVIPALATELSLAQALQRTLTHNPGLQLYPYQQRINDAAAISAGVRPNPELQVELADVLGTGDSSGVKSAELTLSLSQLIELGDKRQKRLELTQWQSELTERQYQLDKVDALAATMRSFLQLLHQQALLDWAEQKITMEQQALDLAKERAQAGNVKDADLSRLELKVLQSRMEHKSLSATKQLNLRLLASHWAGQPDFDAVSGDLTLLPALPALADVLTQLQQAPELQWWLTQQRVLESQLQLAKALGQADLTLGAGIRRNEQTDDNTVVLQLSLPLQLENPQQGTFLATQAATEQAQLQQQQRMQQLQLQTEHSYLQLTQLSEQIKDYQKAVLPLSQQVLEQIAAGYQLGIFDMTDLLSAQQEILLAKRNLIDLHYALHLQLLELERLTGLPLVVNAPQALLQQRSVSSLGAQQELTQ